MSSTNVRDDHAKDETLPRPAGPGSGTYARAPSLTADSSPIRHHPAKIFATALGGGILIDATIIRGVLAPAAVALFGRWNWWLPDWAARILRVEPSALEPEGPSQPAPQVG